jgi:hypothetical protein
VKNQKSKENVFLIYSLILCHLLLLHSRDNGMWYTVKASGYIRDHVQVVLCNSKVQMVVICNVMPFSLEKMY